MNMAGKVLSTQIKIFTDVAAVLDTKNLEGIPNALEIIRKYHEDGLSFYKVGATFQTRGHFEKVQKLYLDLNHQMEQDKPVSIVQGSLVTPSVKSYLENLLNVVEPKRISIVKGILKNMSFDLVTFCLVLCTDCQMLNYLDSDIATTRKAYDEAKMIKVSFRGKDTELVEKCCSSLSKKCNAMKTFVCRTVAGCASHLKSLVQDLVIKYNPALIIVDNGHIFIHGDTYCMDSCKSYLEKSMSHSVQSIESAVMNMKSSTDQISAFYKIGDHIITGSFANDMNRKTNFFMHKPQTSVSNKQVGTWAVHENEVMDIDQDYYTEDEDDIMKEPSTEELHLGPGMPLYLRTFSQDVIKELECKYNVLINENTTKDGVFNITSFKDKITAKTHSDIGREIQNIIFAITLRNIDVNLKDESLLGIILNFKVEATKHKVLLIEDRSKESITILGPERNVDNVCKEIQIMFDRVKPKPARRQRILVSSSDSTENYHHSFSSRQLHSLPILPSTSHYDVEMYKHCATGVTVIVNNTDITKLQVDAIVNAANEDLQHVGGVALAIAEAGGSEIQKECDRFIRKYGRVKVGSGVCVTKAGRMAAKHVIHVVGPQWGQYTSQQDCTDDLKTTFRNVLHIGQTYYANSIAIPAISSGIYAVPPYLVADAACQSIVEYLRSSPKTCIKKIYLVDISSKIVMLYKKQMKHMVEKEIFLELDNTDTRPGTKFSHKTDVVGKYRSTITSDSSGPKSYAVSMSGSTRPYTTSGTKISQSDVSSTFGASMSKSCMASPSLSKISQSDVLTPSGTGMLQLFDHASTGSSVSQSYTSVVNRSNTNRKSDHYTQPTDNIPEVHMNLVKKSNNEKEQQEETDDCCICMCPPINPKVLDKCKHVFCKDCIDRGFEIKPVCPICGKIYGQITGDQPKNGTMLITKDRSTRLPGYNDCGTIIIDYSIPSGIQTKDMQNPGQHYSGTRRRAYLPDNSEGKKVARLLQKAFDARLIFTVGSSRTTGTENTVTWNDIHHKTNIHGGPQKFGYPDPQYLNRVQEELAAKGIKKK